MLIGMTFLGVAFAVMILLLLLSDLDLIKILYIIALSTYCAGIFSYWHYAEMDSLPYENMVYGTENNMSHAYYVLQDNFDMQNSYLHEVLPNGEIVKISPDSAIESVKVIRNEKDKYLVKMGLIELDKTGLHTHRDAYAISDKAALHKLEHNIFLTCQNDLMSAYEYVAPTEDNTVSIEKKHDDIEFLKSVVNH